MARPIPRLSNTVCLVGMSREGSGGYASLLREPAGVEMWSLNQAHAMLPPELMKRVTRWFQIHPWEAMTHRQNPQFGHLEWMKQAKIPVYLEEERPADVPLGVRYPYEEVCGTIGSNYFATNTFCYMVALAIHEGFKRIKVFGCEMDDDDWSDGYARPCMEFFLGFAAGRGIEVNIVGKSALLKMDLYGKSKPAPSYPMEIALDAMERAAAVLLEGNRAMLECWKREMGNQAMHGRGNGEVASYANQS